MTDDEAYMLDIIAGLVRQHCRKDADGMIESGFIGVNADAIDLLCEHGIMVDQTALPHLHHLTRGRLAKWATEGGGE